MICVICFFFFFFFKQKTAYEITEGDWSSDVCSSDLIKERVEHVLKEFVDISGYFRAGYGRNDEGSSQVPFQAPGAPAKYRLGNEAENYGELILAKDWYVPDLFTVDS